LNPGISVEVFQDVLDKLSDVGKKDKLLKFFKLVQDGKFPLNNIAFELFLDIVEWFILSNGFPHLFGVEDPAKMSLSCFGPDINRMKRPPNNFLPNQTNGELMANISFDVIHLCQTILQCPKNAE
jgi:hypothetical protein